VNVSLDNAALLAAIGLVIRASMQMSKATEKLDVTVGRIDKLETKLGIIDEVRRDQAVLGTRVTTLEGEVKRLRDGPDTPEGE
jgi:hypothetical protein